MLIRTHIVYTLLVNRKIMKNSILIILSNNNFGSTFMLSSHATALSAISETPKNIKRRFTKTRIVYTAFC